MSYHLDDSGQMFPSRPLRPDERKLVEEWLASAGDVVSAYISQRRTDDPATYRQIVITIGGDGEPSYFIDTPNGTNYWIVAQSLPFPDVHQFDSLREALNFVRPGTGLFCGVSGR